MMVQCEDCFVWQHVVCMELDEKNLPDKYYCESCHPENHEQLFGRKRKVFFFSSFSFVALIFLSFFLS